jgi:replicative DNA helicase
MLNETRLLHKAISLQDLAPILTKAVDETWFDIDEDRRLFLFMRQFFVNYGESPSIDAVKDNFPAFDLVEVSDPIDYLLDAVVAERRKKATIAMLGEAIKLIDKEKDHEAALLALQGGLVGIEASSFKGAATVDLTNNPEQRYEEYLTRKNTPDGILGYRTGFPTIDKSISGIQNGQLIVVAALPKTGKSTLCLQMALSVHESGNPVMFKSFEMTNDEQARRYDSMRSRLSHHRLMTGTLEQEEETRFLSGLKSLANFKAGFHLVPGAEGRTVTSIANNIQILQPSLVVIDGVYLMQDEQTKEMNTPAALTNITRSLKNLALNVNIPIVINTQYLGHKMKGGRATLDSIGYASSFAQDADIVMGLERIDDDDSVRLLKIMASRNSGGAEVKLSWEWDTATFREFEEDDF